MIHHISRIPLINSKASLFVFADRQQGGSGYRKEAWEEFRHEFKATPNAWAIGLGDYGDWLRPSMRSRLISVLSKDDSARGAFEKDILHSHDKIIDDMEFLKGRLIGIHAGHHLWNLSSGINTDQRLASALKAPYLGWIASTRIVLDTHRPEKPGGGKNYHGHSSVYTMISTHGNANGRKVPTALSWLENNYASSWIVDQYVMGHGCKNANDVPFKRNHIRRIGPPGIEVQIPRLLVIGGFSEGYTNGWESDYVEQAGFAPQPMGYGLIRFGTSYRKEHCLAKGVRSGRETRILVVEQLNRVLSI